MEQPALLRNRNKTLVIVIIAALVVLVVVLETKRRVVATQLENVTVRLEQLQTGNTRENREQAERIVRKVKKLMVIDESIEPTVATIVDINALRKRNPFYNVAENGDFLVVTPTRAILYSEARNVILDVVPVQVKPVPAG